MIFASFTARANEYLISTSRSSVRELGNTYGLETEDFPISAFSCAFRARKLFASRAVAARGIHRNDSILTVLRIPNVNKTAIEVEIERRLQISPRRMPVCSAISTIGLSHSQLSSCLKSLFFMIYTHVLNRGSPRGQESRRTL